MIDKSEMMSLRTEAQRRLAAEYLKRCPLCGAVNAVPNRECFVCRWGGKFDFDPHRVEEGLNLLLERCPELVEAIIDSPTPRNTWFRRLCLKVARAFRRPVRLRM